MKKVLASLFLSLGVLTASNVALAANEPVPDNVAGLVTCGKSDPNNPTAPIRECGFNDLVETIQQTIRFVIFYVIIPLTTLIIFYYGIMLVVNQNKPAQITLLKKALWKVVVGLFFMLTAWLIVEAIVSVFGVRLVDPNQTDGAVDGPIKLLNF